MDYLAGLTEEAQKLALDRFRLTYSKKELKISDPTTLILIDEADRLRMAAKRPRMFFTGSEYSQKIPLSRQQLIESLQFRLRCRQAHKVHTVSIDKAGPSNGVDRIDSLPVHRHGHR